MNKRNEFELDLKQAFSPMPDDCYQALMNAARSVKEEEPMKRASFRAVLIAAAIIILTMAVALAANELGLINFMDKLSAGLPETATQLMAQTESKSFAVGPLQITLRELLADGRVVLMTAQTSTIDSSKAVIVSGSGDTSDRMPASEAKRLGLPEDISFLEAARQAELPLYLVSSYLNINDDLHKGEEMLTEFYGEDGVLLQLDMLQTKPELIQDAIDGSLELHAWEIDPASGETKNDRKWLVEEKITVQVSSDISEKTYKPDGEAVLDGYQVKSVKAEQTVAGIYLTTLAEAEENTKREDVYETLYTWEYKSADGQPFPGGINMSGSLEDDAWPTVTLHQMIGVGNLPDILKLSGMEGTSLITFK